MFLCELFLFCIKVPILLTLKAFFTKWSKMFLPPPPSPSPEPLTVLEMSLYTTERITNSIY